MRIRLAVPDELDDQDRKAALDAALESVTRSNTPMIRSGKWPTAAAAIKAGRVEWKPEPPGDEHFDLPSTVLKRGDGDCDDLAPWHAASLRATGVDPGARAVVRKSGPQRWHAVVKRSDGSIEDPSKAAGMGTNGHQVSGAGGALVVGAYAPIQTPMADDGRMCLCISPGKGPNDSAIWFARCDVPDRLEPWDWSSMAVSHTPAKALLHAITGCRNVAGPDMDPEDQARLGAINDLLMGAAPEQVADALHALMGNVVNADSVVGEAAQSVGFFGGLFKAIASPIRGAGKLLSHVPLVGPIAHAAAALALLPEHAALQLLQGKRIDHIALGELKSVISSVTALAPYVQTVLSLVPGVGSGLSAGIGGALALAHGQSISAALIEAVKSALPGGALAQAAFSVASDAMQGKPISQMAIDALPVPTQAKQALIQGLKATAALTAGKPFSQTLLDSALKALPAAAQRAVQVGVALGHAKTLQQTQGHTVPPEIPGLPGMIGPLTAAMKAGAHRASEQVLNAPRLMYDPHKVVRPWGPSGPAVMRF